MHILVSNKVKNYFQEIYGLQLIFIFVANPLTNATIFDHRRPDRRLISLMFRIPERHLSARVACGSDFLIALLMINSCIKLSE